jgi:5-methylthioadenosine/S-adenosylhomocysteine deaminase
VLEMATQRGARALGTGNQTGSLEAGKAADLIALDMQALRHHPVYDPIAQIIHTNSGPSVTHVWVAGQCLLDDGNLTRMDEARIRETAADWKARITAP